MLTLALALVGGIGCTGDPGSGEKPADETGETGGGGETGETGEMGDPFGVTCDLVVPDDHESVGEGLAAAPEGATVCVRAGTWAANLDFAGRAVRVVGEGTEETILDGGEAGRVASFVTGEGAGAGLRALTLTGGAADGGAGLYVLEGATPEIVDVVIRGSRCLGEESTVRGVGLYAEGGTLSGVVVEESTCALELVAGTKIYGTGAYVRAGATVSDLKVWRNTGYAYEITGAFVAKDLDVALAGVEVHDNDAEASLSCLGGGAHLSGRTSAASRLDLRGNRCASGGDARAAGLHIFVDGAITLENIIVAGNSAEASGAVSGAGVRLSGAVTLVQADIVGNTASGSRVEGAALAMEGEGITLRNVSVYGNVSEASDSSDVFSVSSSPDLGYSAWAEASFGGGLSAPGADAGNIYEDPRYTDVTSSDPADWDLTLQAGSPLIDAGDPERSDLDGSPSDIGAHGGSGM